MLGLREGRGEGAEKTVSVPLCGPSSRNEDKRRLGSVGRREPYLGLTNIGGVPLARLNAKNDGCLVSIDYVEAGSNVQPRVLQFEPIVR